MSMGSRKWKRSVYSCDKQKVKESTYMSLRRNKKILKRNRRKEQETEQIMG